MNWSKACLLAALAAAVPMAQAGTLSTAALWGPDYPVFECVVTNAEHPVSAVVHIDIYGNGATAVASQDVTVAPGETAVVSYTPIYSGSARCSFDIPGPAKDMKDFRAAIRMHDQYGALGPALPAS